MWLLCCFSNLIRPEMDLKNVRNISSQYKCCGKTCSDLVRCRRTLTLSFGQAEQVDLQEFELFVCVFKCAVCNKYLRDMSRRLGWVGGGKKTRGGCLEQKVRTQGKEFEAEEGGVHGIVLMGGQPRF